MKVPNIIVFLACIGCLISTWAWVGFKISESKNYDAYVWLSEHNNRGTIKCVNDHWEISNIDIAGHNKDGSNIWNLNECERP